MSYMAFRDRPVDWINKLEYFANDPHSDAHAHEDFVREIYRKIDRDSDVAQTKVDFYKEWRSTLGATPSFPKVNASYFFVPDLSSDPAGTFLPPALSTGSSSTRKKQENDNDMPVKRVHRIMWLALVLFSALWGVMAAKILSFSNYPMERQVGQRTT